MASKVLALSHAINDPRTQEAIRALELAVQAGTFDNVGFQGAPPIPKPAVTGSRAGNAALASLLTALAAYGLITDSTTV